MQSRNANLTVFITSAVILVLEIVAGRLLAPYVGISLETFTAIIGTVLAGIALGSAAGGWVADQLNPRKLIGPVLVIGGVLAWTSLPIITFLGPRVGIDVVSIVFLTAAAFFPTATALSMVSPMVAKLRLESLDDTGSVVGGLSAAGTLGALAGTFITGFVLVALLPSRTIVIAAGVLAVLIGLLFWWTDDGRPPAGVLAAVLLVGVTAPMASSVCDRETEYFCVRVEVDPDRASGRSLYLDQLRHAYIDLEDPTFLDIRYIRLFASVAGSQTDGPLDTLHIGGGGFTFPRYLSHVRPGSSNLVLELDAELVTIAEDELGLDTNDDLTIITGDARLALDDLPADGFDLIVGDVFGSVSVPWHLTTAEVMTELDRALRPDGIYVMNVIDGGANRFARAELATLRAQFDHLGLILPTEEVPDGGRFNLILLASDQPLPPIGLDPNDGEFFTGDAVEDFIGDADILTDSFAPVDQLHA